MTLRGSGRRSILGSNGSSLLTIVIDEIEKKETDREVCREFVRLFIYLLIYLCMNGDYFDTEQIRTELTI